MNRWTRLVTRLKSSELHRRFSGGAIRFGSLSLRFSNVELYPQKTLTCCTLIQSSSLRFSNVASFSTNSVNHPPERRELPEELSRNVVALTCESTAEGGSCDVYLVGTFHDSQDSCKQVQAIIRFLKPEVVFLELCSSLKHILTTQTPKVETMGDMIQHWKKKINLFGDMIEHEPKEPEVVHDSEFRVAFQEATSYGGKYILGDRPTEITMWRILTKMPFWQTTKSVCSLRFRKDLLQSAKNIEKMDCDSNTLFFQEMDKKFPTLMEILVHERDQYMSAVLWKVAKEHSSVVAVVGKGHLPGIKKHWKQPIEALRLKEIMEMPPAKPARVLALKLLGVFVKIYLILHSF